MTDEIDIYRAAKVSCTLSRQHTDFICAEVLAEADRS